MLFDLSKNPALSKLDRKFKKLQRDPDLFIKDMISNKKEQIQETINKISPIKSVTKNKFTIVSAVYNVSKYLDDYFESIVNQSVDFKKSIFIICVDDGSTDNSADIIKKWQKKYPKNIQYIYKENGGQSSARNLGLDYVKTDWVLFTDPDDFFHPNYIKNIDLALQNNNKIKMLVTNMVFYFEDKNIKKDTHPLRYRFHGKTTNFDIKKLEKNMNLSAATSVFHMLEIKKNKLRFNPEIKPNFEDGKFIADYMLAVDGHITFLKNSVYYYRKRSDSSSTLDTAWAKPEKFYNVLKYGHLDMLKSYQEKLGFVPPHIQRTALYDMAWYVGYLLNSPSKTDFLTPEQKKNFIKLLFEIFQYINAETIMSFNLAGVWFKQKIGMLGYFKNIEPNFQIAYIENIDRENKQILISFFSTMDMDVSYRLNGKDVLPKFYKLTNNTLLDDVFVSEYRAWIEYQNLDDVFSIYINEIEAKFSILGVEFNNKVFINDIVLSFTPSYKYNVDGSWVFVDRSMQADDNAEYLYRYIFRNHLKEDCYFALSRNSADWDRLEKEGFKLIDFGSDIFEAKLKSCSKIISSNVDHYITNYFGDEYEYSKKIIFLQHGVIHNDLSSWLNTQKNINLFVTSTQDEYNSIVKHKSRYKFCNKEVKLTGMPRHDYLLKSDQVEEKIILVMPTWRKNIVGKAIDKSNIRQINNNFKNESYCKAWEGFLNNEKLKKLYEKYGYKVVFAPHVNITPYLSVMNIPSFIQVWSKDKNYENLQSIFKKSKVFITDYSSAAFDLAYLNKAIIYYQFDKEEFFSGSHTSQLSYFEYENDGFGPVVEQLEQLEQALEQILQNNGKALEPYLTRMENTFPFKDSRCCERVYNAIIALNHEENSHNLELAHIFLNQAYEFKNYNLVRERAENILLLPDLNETDKQAVYEKLAESYLKLNDIDSLGSLLEYYNSDYYASKWLATLPHREKVLDLIGGEITKDHYLLLRISILFNLNILDADKLNSLLQQRDNLSELETVLLECYLSYISSDWSSLDERLSFIQSFIGDIDNVWEKYIRNDLVLMRLFVSKFLKKTDFTSTLDVIS